MGPLCEQISYLKLYEIGSVGLETRGDPSRWPHDTFDPQKLALTSPTSRGRSLGIARLRTKTTEFYEIGNETCSRKCSSFVFAISAPNGSFLQRTILGNHIDIASRKENTCVVIVTEKIIFDFCNFFWVTYSFEPEDMQSIEQNFLVMFHVLFTVLYCPFD
jgi:hypothetical protein